MRCTRFLHTSHYKLRFCPAFVSFAAGTVCALPRTATTRFDGTRRARLSKANGGRRCKKRPVSVHLHPRFLALTQTPARYPRRLLSRGRRKADVPTKHCTQSANTPPVQLHTMAAHAAKQNRIRGKEDKGDEMKKNLPSPTRRSDVERQRTEGDNGVFEGDNTPHFDGIVALPEGGSSQRQHPSCAVARNGCARRQAK